MTDAAADLGPLLARRRAPATAARGRAAHAERARPRARSAVALVVACGVVLAAAAGWLSGRAGPVDRPGSLAPAAPPAVAAPDWHAVLDDLDAARARAFAAADDELLAHVHAPGAPGAAADRASIAQLAAQGRTVHGLRRDLRAVTVQRATADRAVLRVVDALPPHDVRDARGAPVLALPGRGERVFTVVLARTAAGWRLAAVVPDRPG